MAHPRPHVQTVRLTTEQNQHAKRRMLAEGTTFQKVLTAAINAYIRGEFRVSASGRYSVGPADEVGALSFADDDDALDLAALEEEAEQSERQQENHWLGTRELADLAQEQTGRRVPLPLLRRLVRLRWPQEGTGPGKRYRWHEDDAQVSEIVEAIRGGALDEVRQQALGEATSHRSHPSASA